MCSHRQNEFAAVRRFPCKLLVMLHVKTKEKNFSRHSMTLRKLSNCKKPNSGPASMVFNGIEHLPFKAISEWLLIMVVMALKLLRLQQKVMALQKKWGGRLVRWWVHDWIKHHKLPVSSRGRHVKVYTLLSNPTICTEL
jgi:hypothetical protein